VAVACGALLAACRNEIADVDGVFYRGDGHGVHCALSVDAKANSGTDNIDGALDRARDRGEVLELYAHHPGVTVPVETLAHLLAGARDRGIGSVTYSDFAAGSFAAPGLALSFDDTSVDAWVEQIPLFQQYGARITFFVSRYPEFKDAQRAGLE